MIAWPSAQTGTARFGMERPGKKPAAGLAIHRAPTIRSARALSRVYRCGRHLTEELGA